MRLYDALVSILLQSQKIYAIDHSLPSMQLLITGSGVASPTI